MTPRFFSFIVLLFLLACKPTGYRATQTENRSRAIDPTVATEASPTAEQVAQTIAPYRSQLGTKMEEEIATLVTDLEKGRPESRLGNWVADILLEAAENAFPDRQIDFAVQNYGGIRIGSLAAGPVTVGDIYELMPFDNELVLQELNGFVLQEFLDHLAADGGWPISRGIRFRIEEKRAVDVLIDGEALALNRNYTVALPDYVANGGSDASMLSDRRQISSGKLIRDLLIEGARKAQGPIRVEREGRIEK